MDKLETRDEMMKRGLLRWGPVAAWMLVIFIGSSIGSLPHAERQIVDASIHRVSHVIEFSILGLLLLRAVSYKRSVTRRDIALTLIVAALYGASDEFHQRFTPGRSSEAVAVLWDVLGTLIGAWIWRWRKTTTNWGSNE